jgi:ATP-dependent Zn protease
LTDRPGTKPGFFYGFRNGSNYGMTERKETAYHEAGHALASYRMNTSADELSIIPNEEENSQGRLYTLEQDDCSMKGIHDAAIILYAGGEAARIAGDGKEPEGIWSDYEKAQELIKPYPELDEYQLQDEAAQLLRTNWQHVHAIASALMELKTLSGEEWQIIISAIDDRLDWRQELAQLRMLQTEFKESTSS